VWPPVDAAEDAAAAPRSVATEEPDAKDFDPRRQFVVIIRHGKTENNKLGIFTGWEGVDP